MRKLLVVNYVFVVFLTLIFIAGVLTTWTYYEKYGVSWVETKIIHGEIETKTVTICQSAISTITFLLLAISFALNASVIRLQEEQEIEG